MSQPLSRPVTDQTTQRLRKPESLRDWIIAKGGVQDENGELAASDLDKIHHRQGGRLVNPKGMNWDLMRQAAAEEGFPVGNDRRSFMDALTSREPVYRPEDAHLGEQWRQANTQAFQEDEARYNSRDAVATAADQAGIRLSKPELDHATDLHMQGMHPEEALRQATAQREDELLQRDAEKNAFGRSGVPPQAEQTDNGLGARPTLTPNFNAEAAARSSTARQATLERKQTFGQNEIGAVLRSGQNGAEYRVDVANVPRTFLSGGPVEPAAVQRYIAAVGGAPQAVEAMRGALVNDLREKGIINADGTLDTRRFTSWQRQRARTIALFPGLGEGLENARAAQITYDQAVANHVQAVRDYQHGAARNFLNADPQVAMDRVFTSANPTAASRELYNMVRNDPDALAGLQRGAINYLERRFHFDADPKATGRKITEGSFRTAWPQLRGPLKAIFGGQGVQNIEMVYSALNRQAAAVQKQATPGSPTAQKFMAAGHAMGHAVAGGGTATALFALVGEHLAENATHLLGGSGIMGAAAAIGGVAGGLWLNSLRQAGIHTMNDLVKEMALHPEVAREMLRRVDAKKGMSALMQKKVAAAIQGAIAADVSQSQKADQ